MNMFLHELKSYRKSTIIWACSLSALAVFMLSIYPVFANDAAELQKLLEGYPLAVRKALGIPEDIFSLPGFYSFIFLYMLLCGSIQAMNLGTSIVSKEISQKTADFLLAKPVTRMQILSAKLSAAFASLIATNIVYLITVVIMAGIVKTGDFSMKAYMMISFTLFFVQLMFMAMGVAAGSIAPKIKSSLSVSLSTVFGLFIINMVSSVISEDLLRYITPFKYYDPQYIIRNEAYETPFVILELIIIAAAIGVSCWIYSKKDIHTI